MGDTYGLLFDCSVDDFVKPQPVSCFNTLAKEAADKKGNIGKTWMISGSLPEATKTNSETLANLAAVAYKALLSEGWEKPETTGKFLGATVFEVWQPPQKWKNVEEENSHVLIIVYPNLLTMQKAADFYGDWLRLFLSRNKIIWEYNYAKKLKHSLQNNFSFIKNKVKEVKEIYPESNEVKLSPKQLKELQEILINSIDTLSTYIKNLSNLEIISIAIDTNLRNYQKYLKQIVDKAKDNQAE